jgi:hypothetical protein
LLSNQSWFDAAYFRRDLSKKQLSIHRAQAKQLMKARANVLRFSQFQLDFNSRSTHPELMLLCLSFQLSSKDGKGRTLPNFWAGFVSPFFGDNKTS